MNDLPEDHLRSHLRQSLEEDRARNDTTTQSLPDPHQPVQAELLARETGVLAGLDLVELTLEIVADFPEFPDDPPEIDRLAADGDAVESDATITRIQGPASIILSGERIGLNYLQQLSGVASLTHRLVELAHPHGVDIYDTRKTVPHLRKLQKYAVRCGGGKNHRMNLSEAVMIKDNHKKLADGLRNFLDCLETRKPVVVEIHDPDELDALESTLDKGGYDFDIDVVMLDNFNPEMVRTAVDAVPGDIQVEVSGGINENNIEGFCRAGPDRISVGALTHSFDSLDISLNLTSHLTS